jgi:hypothetical protein
VFCGQVIAFALFLVAEVAPVAAGNWVALFATLTRA